MSDLQVQYVSPDRLRPYPGNARSHSRKQLKLIEKSILRFGFTNPILVTNDFEVVAGHGRLLAAKSLGLQLVPVVASSSLSEADKKALIIADNRIAELSNWDRDILAIEYQALEELQFEDIEVTGFSLGEIDTILDDAAEKQPNEPGPEDQRSLRHCRAGLPEGRSVVPRIASPPVRGCSLRGGLRPPARGRECRPGPDRSAFKCSRRWQRVRARQGPPRRVRDGLRRDVGTEFTTFLSHSSAVPRPIPGMARSCSCSWTGGICSSSPAPAASRA